MGDVEARYINTKLNVSDVMTKGASREVTATQQAVIMYLQTKMAI